MKLSQLYTKTSKSVPKDEEAVNARLLIQAGYIHKEMAGVYSYLPLGKKVLDNISNIVREEMNKIGGLEVQMSILQPKDIWEITDRWDDKKVDNWFKTRLSSGQELGIGLTHEEPIVDSLKSFINSYKDLPVYPYQIQSKFRNELRAKSGLLRGREFVMKDMYSFSIDQQQHREFYELAAKAYFKIYKRLGLGDITYRTYADGGIFSTEFSDEFQAISPIGEDLIYIDKEKNIAINKEIYNEATLKKLGLKAENLVQETAVEVGNIFHLNSKYTDALELYYSDPKGQQKSIIMGSYGIGISRLMGLLAELFADNKGLVWSKEVAPYKIYLTSISQDKTEIKRANDIYSILTQNKIAVLYDDRDIRPGEKFADADLLGIPYRVVISPKIKQDQVELKARSSNEPRIVNIAELLKK